MKRCLLPDPEKSLRETLVNSCDLDIVHISQLEALLFYASLGVLLVTSAFSPFHFSCHYGALYLLNGGRVVDPYAQVHVILLPHRASVPS